VLCSDNKRDTVSFKEHKSDGYETEVKAQAIYRLFKEKPQIHYEELKTSSQFTCRNVPCSSREAERRNDTEILVDVLEHVKGGIRIGNKENVARSITYKTTKTSRKRQYCNHDQIKLS
jgi:hypothetical protein